MAGSIPTCWIVISASDEVTDPAHSRPIAGAPGTNIATTISASWRVK